MPSTNECNGNSGGAGIGALDKIPRLPRSAFLLYLLVLFVGFSSFARIQAFPMTELRHFKSNERVSAFLRSKMDASTAETTTVSLQDYLEGRIHRGEMEKDLAKVLLGVAKSCAEVSRRLKTHTLDHNSAVATTSINIQGEQQKSMDVVANDIFVQTLHSIDSVAAMASEEEEEVIYTKTKAKAKTNNNNNRRLYEIAFDPLDGSGNLDVNLPTGSIFGIGESTTQAFSKPGSDLVASGYALYSSSTELVVTLGKDQPVLGFTLLVDGIHDDENDSCEFILSRNAIQCPPHGPYYSLNEAREPDWPDGLKQWIHDSKRGKTKTGQIYSSRYVCSLCADFHRTLLQGGWAGNPRPHLRLLYEAAPLAFLMESAGGRGSDGRQSLLEIVPEGLHDRVCVFLGSSEDIEDLESYGNVQQVQAKRYEA